MSVSLISQAAPEDLLARLENGAQETLAMPAGRGDKRIVGHFHGKHFVLAMARSYHGWNWFAPLFYGRVEPGEEGCRIQGEFRMSYMVHCLIALWLILFVASCFANIRNYGLTMEKSRGLIPAGMLVFGFLVVRIGQWLGRTDEIRLARFMEKAAWAGRQGGPKGEKPS